MPVVDRGEPNSRPLEQTVPSQASPAEEVRFTYKSGDTPLAGYTIKRGIGRGGFGEVYYATSDAGKEVALKLLCRHLDVELRGIQHCLNLKHPNLLMIYDVRRDARGDTWVIMELIRGPSLEQVLEDQPQGLAVSEVLQWFHGLAAGVAYLHRHGIVHRDLKPGNVFREEGVVKVGDYGLAKYISCSRRSGQTQSVGTVHYMAPEIAHGRYGKEIDIYAMGIILYEMLTGKLPFDGQSAGEILMKHLTAQPDLTPVPEPFREVIRRALEKDPARRYHSVEEMLAEMPALPCDGKTGFTRFEESPGFQDRGPDARQTPQSASTPGNPQGGATAPVSSSIQDPIGAGLKRAFREMRQAWDSIQLPTPIKAALLVGLGLILAFHFGLVSLVVVALLMSWVTFWVIHSVMESFRQRSAEKVVQAQVVALASPQAASPATPVIVAKPVAPPTRKEAFRQQWAQKSFRAHVADLLGSLLGVVVIGAVVAFVGYLLQSFWGDLPNTLQAAWLYLVTVAGAWGVLIVTKLWHGREGDAVLRRFISMILGFAVGALAYFLASYLNVDLPYNPRWPNFHDWQPPAAFYRDGQPMLPAMVAAFGTLFLLVRWWRLADPLRGRRFSFWGVFGPGLAAMLTSAIWVFPAQWLVLPAVGMGITLQLAAPWFPNRPRLWASALNREAKP